MAQVRIFVSHSSHDNVWCRPFADALKAVGYDVWYDETGLQGGAAWVASIQHEVETRDVFLLVLTPEAWESKWVQDELQLAIATRRRVLPVLLRNTQVSGFLLTTQWITVIGEEPQAAARTAIMAVEAPPAPGRNAAPQATTETLDDLITLCKSLSTERRYTEALSACERALALDPKNIDVLKIKANVLAAIHEPRLEGLTWFQALLADPDDQSVMSSYYKVFRTINDEQELLQAYSLYYGQLSGSQRHVLLTPLLDGLNRINHLDAAMDILVQLDDDPIRIMVWRQLYGMMRPDLEVQLLEKWYGYPPRLNTIDDIPTLDMYAQSLTAVGRREDAKSVRSLIVHIFEDRFGETLRWRFVKRVFDGYYSSPWQSDSERAAYKVYLTSLDNVGRAHDVTRLRKAYGDG